MWSTESPAKSAPTTQGEQTSTRPAVIGGAMIDESIFKAYDIRGVYPDALYFAVGHLEEPGGAMITASHNPKDYNGFKLCREEAIALSGDEGIKQIRDLITSGELPEPTDYAGSVEEGDITLEYAEHCL